MYLSYILPLLLNRLDPSRKLLKEGAIPTLNLVPEMSNNYKKIPRLENLSQQQSATHPEISTGDSSSSISSSSKSTKKSGRKFKTRYMERASPTYPYSPVCTSSNNNFNSPELSPQHPPPLLQKSTSTDDAEPTRNSSLLSSDHDVKEYENYRPIPSARSRSQLKTMKPKTNKRLLLSKQNSTEKRFANEMEEEEQQVLLLKHLHQPQQTQQAQQQWEQSDLKHSTSPQGWTKRVSSTSGWGHSWSDDPPSSNRYVERMSPVFVASSVPLSRNSRITVGMPPSSRISPLQEFQGRNRFYYSTQHSASSSQTNAPSPSRESSSSCITSLSQNYQSILTSNYKYSKLRTRPGENSARRKHVGARSSRSTNTSDITIVTYCSVFHTIPQTTDIATSFPRNHYSSDNIVFESGNELPRSPLNSDHVANQTESIIGTATQFNGNVRNSKTSLHQTDLHKISYNGFGSIIDETSDIENTYIQGVSVANAMYDGNLSTNSLDETESQRRYSIKESTPYISSHLDLADESKAASSILTVSNSITNKRQQRGDRLHSTSYSRQYYSDRPSVTSSHENSDDDIILPR